MFTIMMCTGISIIRPYADHWCATPNAPSTYCSHYLVSHWTILRSPYITKRGKQYNNIMPSTSTVFYH